MKWAIEKKLRAGYLLALALLLILGVVSYQTTRKFSETERWESRIEAALDKLAEISSQLREAETGHRGYLITGDEKYLEPYHVAIQTTDQELAELRALTPNNP